MNVPGRQILWAKATPRSRPGSQAGRRQLVRRSASVQADIFSFCGFEPSPGPVRPGSCCDQTVDHGRPARYEAGSRAAPLPRRHQRADHEPVVARLVICSTSRVHAFPRFVASATRTSSPSVRAEEPGARRRRPLAPAFASIQHSRSASISSAMLRLARRGTRRSTSLAADSQAKTRRRPLTGRLRRLARVPQRPREVPAACSSTSSGRMHLRTVLTEEGARHRSSTVSRRTSRSTATGAFPQHTTYLVVETDDIGHLPERS